VKVHNPIDAFGKIKKEEPPSGKILSFAWISDLNNREVSSD
jgi:hypothetical protein